MVCTRPSTMHSVSWVISNMGATTKLTFFVIADYILKEYEIILLIYNRIFMHV